MKRLLIVILTIVAIAPCYAVNKASEKRLDEVAQRGSHVMPFDLNLTTHIFSKTAKGGVQKIIVKNPQDHDQVRLIREHLAKISDEFKHANYSDPTKIHGNKMPGLKTLKNAKSGQINIQYKNVPKGAQITYLTENPKLITAIHQWFDAQLSDHARNARSGHSSHHMHHK